MAISPETSKLPEFRVSCNHPFENVGVDYAGPLYFKENADNCVQMSKCYVLLFTWAATRAVYLELTPDAGVHCLILAVRRFISRNWTLKLFISDNFKSFKSKDIKSYLREVNINWKLILEKSPWWGGFYERLIVVMKNLLKKAMGKSSFNLWRDLDDFNRNRKHNQLSTIKVYEWQPWWKFLSHLTTWFTDAI